MDCRCLAVVAAVAARRLQRPTGPVGAAARRRVEPLVEHRGQRRRRDACTSSTPTPTRSRSSTRARGTLDARGAARRGGRPRSTATGRYEPAVSRARSRSARTRSTLYVTGQRSGHVYAIDAASGAVVARRARLLASRSASLVSPDGGTVYVACSQDDTVVALDASTLVAAARVAVSRKPWALAWSADRTQLYVDAPARPGRDGARSPSPLAVHRRRGPLPDTARRAWTIRRLAARPGARHLRRRCRGPARTRRWVAHMMLGTDTPQPTLDFDTTVFPALSLFDRRRRRAGASHRAARTPRRSTARSATSCRARTRSRSPPTAALALVADTNSEDVLVVDADHARRGDPRAAAARPPARGHRRRRPTAHAYVDERNTGDVAVLDVDARAAARPSPSTARRSRGSRSDPMPAAAAPRPAPLLLGEQRRATRSRRTTGSSCASCHLEGRSDAVTWQFSRARATRRRTRAACSTPAFCFRTAGAQQGAGLLARRSTSSRAAHFSTDRCRRSSATSTRSPQYVNYAIPYPSPPTRPRSGRWSPQGQQLFATARLRELPRGPALHRLGRRQPDARSRARSRDRRPACCSTTSARASRPGRTPTSRTPTTTATRARACAFDTPSLRGIADTRAVPPRRQRGDARGRLPSRAGAWSALRRSRCRRRSRQRSSRT